MKMALLSLRARLPLRGLNPRENVPNVIAKERSDCGNLNSCALASAHFLRKSLATKQSQAFQQAHSPKKNEKRAASYNAHSP
jgi:hypothetical protein